MEPPDWRLFGVSRLDACARACPGAFVSEGGECLHDEGRVFSIFGAKSLAQPDVVGHQLVDAVFQAFLDGIFAVDGPGGQQGALFAMDVLNRVVGCPGRFHGVVVYLGNAGHVVVGRAHDVENLHVGGAAALVMPAAFFPLEGLVAKASTSTVLFSMPR